MNEYSEREEVKENVLLLYFLYTQRHISINIVLVSDIVLGVCACVIEFHHGYSTYISGGRESFCQTK